MMIMVMMMMMATATMIIMVMMVLTDWFLWSKRGVFTTRYECYLYL